LLKPASLPRGIGNYTAFIGKSNADKYNQFYPFPYTGAPSGIAQGRKIARKIGIIISPIERKIEMARTTEKELELLVTTLNRITNSPPAQYTKTETGYVQNPDNFQLDSGYGMVGLNRALDAGVDRIFHFCTKYELALQLRAMIRGYLLAKDAQADLLSVASGCLGYFQYLAAQPDAAQWVPDASWLAPLQSAINKAKDVTK